MVNLDQIIDYTKTYQDIELATAIGQLKKNPTQLQLFLQNQQDNVYKDVTKQKDSTFDKVYGDLNRATKAQESIIMHNKRNKELAELNNKVYQKQKRAAEAVTDDKNIANRKYEMNEWTVNNKRETLFVFSMLFIILSSLILITVLQRMGIISTSLYVALSSLGLIIFILTVVYRSQFTDVYRDKRYWNRRTFGKYGKVPVPMCPDITNSIQSGINSLGDTAMNFRNNLAEGARYAAENIAEGAR